MEQSTFAFNPAFSPHSWPSTSTPFSIESLSPLSPALHDDELQAVLTTLDLAQTSNPQDIFANQPGGKAIHSPPQNSLSPHTWQQPMHHGSINPSRPPQHKRIRTISDPRSQQQRPIRSLSDASEESSQDSRPRCFEHGCNGRTFSNMDNYKRHIREQRSITSVECPFCGKEFSRKSNMDTHVAKKRCKVVNTWASATHWNSV